MSLAVLEAPARTIHPLEQAVLDHLDDHPAASLAQACAAQPSITTHERAVGLVARLLWHRRLPLLMARTGADRMWFGLPEAVALACLLLSETDTPHGVPE